MLTFPGRIWFAGLTILAVIEFAWIYVAGHRVLVSSIHQAGLAAVGAFVIVVLVHLLLRAQRNGVPVIGTPASRRTIATFQTFFEGYLFIVLGWLSLRLLNHLTMKLMSSTSKPHTPVCVSCAPSTPNGAVVGPMITLAPHTTS